MLKIKKPNKADNMTYKAFKAALEANKIGIYINDSMLNRPGIAVYNPWENLLPRLVPVLFGLVILYYSIFWGVVVVLGSIGIGERVFRKQNTSRLFERTKKYISKDYQNLNEIWELGGIILSSTEKEKVFSVSPKDDWKDFVIQNFSEFMIQKKKEEPKEEAVVSSEKLKEIRSERFRRKR